MELDTKHESASNLCEAAQVLKREDPRGMYHVCREIQCVTGCFLTYNDCGSNIVVHLCDYDCYLPLPAISQRLSSAI